jgi:hypothetical protein
MEQLATSLLRPTAQDCTQLSVVREYLEDRELVGIERYFERGCGRPALTIVCFCEEIVILGAFVGESICVH